jgi:outer membrane biogenesis lipoprotein LolB
MRRGAFCLLALFAAFLLMGCGDSVSQGQADDRAAQMREASQRPEEKGTQE